MSIVQRQKFRGKRAKTIGLPKNQAHHLWAVFHLLLSTRYDDEIRLYYLWISRRNKPSDKRDICFLSLQHMPYMRIARWMWICSVNTEWVMGTVNTEHPIRAVRNRFVVVKPQSACVLLLFFAKIIIFHSVEPEQTGKHRVNSVWFDSNELLLISLRGVVNVICMSCEQHRNWANTKKEKVILFGNAKSDLHHFGLNLFCFG